MESKSRELLDRAMEQVEAMKIQERRSYPSCGDYITLHVSSPLAAAALSAKTQTEEEPRMRRDPSSIAIHTLDGSQSPRTVVTRPPTNFVDMECRSKMCEWFYQVIDYCSLARDTVQICMSYLDTFLSLQPHPYLFDRERYQLAAITSLYLSIKLHEPVELDVKLLTVLSRGTYSQRNIVEMEQIILNTLQWRMNPPIPNSFVSCYMECLKSDCDTSRGELYAVNILATFQTELGTVDYTMKCSDKLFSSNEIALASVLNAVEAIQDMNGLNKFCAQLRVCGVKEDFRSERISSVRSHLSQVFALSRQKTLWDEGTIVLQELRCSA